MEVILKKDIDKLGYKNDLVKVKNGFARNYLIPKSMAIYANSSVKKAHAEMLSQRKHKDERILNDALEMKDKLNSLEIKLQVKVSATGKVFGSITEVQITKELNKKGFLDIAHKQVELLANQNIKKLGNYKASVKLHKDVSAEINFEVVEKNK